MKWSERQIATAVSKKLFENKYLVMVPNCNWTGHECDVLVVTENLRIIDVEIKISRADLKADAKKRKWYHNWDFSIDGPWRDGNRRRAEWPDKVWKHYYVMPEEIWDDKLFDTLGSPRSGVVLLRRISNGEVRAHVKRRAEPNRDAQKLSPEIAVNIARLASLRMWDAYAKLDAVANK